MKNNHDKIELYLIDSPHRHAREEFFPKGVMVHDDIFSFLTYTKNCSGVMPAFIVFLHANNAENKLRVSLNNIADWNSRYELILNLSLLICSKGGRVLIFTGGDLWNFDKREFEEIMLKNNFEKEKHYTFCTINNIDNCFHPFQIGSNKFKSFRISSLKKSKFLYSNPIDYDFENCIIDPAHPLIRKLKTGQKILINGYDEFALDLRNNLNHFFQFNASESEVLFDKSILKKKKEELDEFKEYLKNIIILVIPPSLLNTTESLISYYNFLFSNKILDGQCILGIYSCNSNIEYLSRNDILGTNNPKLMINKIPGLNAIAIPFKLSDFVQNLTSLYPERRLFYEVYHRNLERANLLPVLQTKLSNYDKAIFDNKFEEANLIYQAIIGELKNIDIDRFFATGEHLNNLFFNKLTEINSIDERIGFLKEFICTKSNNFASKAEKN